MSEQMTKLHQMVTKAVAVSVKTRGISEQEAFRNHMKELMQKTPAVFFAYSKWLAQTSSN